MDVNSYKQVVLTLLLFQPQKKDFRKRILVGDLKILCASNCCGVKTRP
jgi:hypothetical protein